MITTKRLRNSSPKPMPEAIRRKLGTHAAEILNDPKLFQP
jgi:hypothetical protein